MTSHKCMQTPCCTQCMFDSILLYCNWSTLEANASVRLVCKSFLQSFVCLLLRFMHAASDAVHLFLKWPDLFIANGRMRTVTLYVVCNVLFCREKDTNLYFLMFNWTIRTIKTRCIYRLLVSVLCNCDWLELKQLLIYLIPSCSSATHGMTKSLLENGHVEKCDATLLN